MGVASSEGEESDDEEEEEEEEAGNETVNTTLTEGTECTSASYDTCPCV